MTTPFFSLLPQGGMGGVGRKQPCLQVLIGYGTGPLLTEVSDFFLKDKGETFKCAFRGQTASEAVPRPRVVYKMLPVCKRSLSTRTENE